MKTSLFRQRRLQTCRAVFVVGLSLLLSSCATPYKPDLANKPTARVRVVSTHSLPTHIGVPKEQCLPATAISWDVNIQSMGVLERSRPRQESIGMPATSLPSGALYRELVIPAGTAWDLGFYATNSGATIYMSCAVGIQFTPVEGADYEASFSEGSRTCGATVSRIMKRSDGSFALERVGDAVPLPRC